MPRVSVTCRPLMGRYGSDSTIVSPCRSGASAHNRVVYITTRLCTANNTHDTHFSRRCCKYIMYISISRHASHLTPPTTHSTLTSPLANAGLAAPHRGLREVERGHVERGERVVRREAARAAAEQTPAEAPAFAEHAAPQPLEPLAKTRRRLGWGPHAAGGVAGGEALVLVGRCGDPKRAHHPDRARSGRRYASEPGGCLGHPGGGGGLLGGGRRRGRAAARRRRSPGPGHGARSGRRRRGGPEARVPGRVGSGRSRSVAGPKAGLRSRAARHARLQAPRCP